MKKNTLIILFIGIFSLQAYAENEASLLMSAPQNTEVNPNNIVALDPNLQNTNNNLVVQTPETPMLNAEPGVQPVVATPLVADAGQTPSVEAQPAVVNASTGAETVAQETDVPTVTEVKEEIQSGEKIPENAPEGSVVSAGLSNPHTKEEFDKMVKQIADAFTTGISEEAAKKILLDNNFPETDADAVLTAAKNISDAAKAVAENK